MCDAVVCDCGGPNKLHYFCEKCAEGDTNVGANPEVVKFRKERFLGICPTAKVKSTIREDWRKRTEIDNVKIKQCPYAMGYVEFEECQQPIGAGPNLKGAKIGEEPTYGSFRIGKNAEAVIALNEAQKLCTWSGTLSGFRAHMLICPLAPVRCHYCTPKVRRANPSPLRRFELYNHLQSEHGPTAVVDGILTPSAPRLYKPPKPCTLKDLHDEELKTEAKERIEEVEVLERIILDPKTAGEETKVFFDKANIIKEQGQYKKAVRYFQLSQRGLKLGLDRVRVKNNPILTNGSTYDTYFASMGNLANTYIDMKDYTSGQECYLEILALHEKLYGIGHKNTLLACNNLGTCYKIKEDFEKALAMHERAYIGRLKLHGELHIDTLTSANSMGSVYDVGLNDLDNALKYYSIAEKGRVKLLGPNANKSLESQLNIAHIKSLKGKIDEATGILRRTLQKYEKHFGVENKSSKICAQRFVKTMLMKGQKDLGQEEMSEMKKVMIRYKVNGLEED
ncbi:hypothetical protein TrVE_jg13564 [Triparma verrucosa]|uniref:Uncharacterized protein n=1 Tax=Triparma verrucosa TaxID=1606542 RepID=A0A9W7KV87_9STRA|nr:hypothetical protein TrVE_jg13564 [Triparma verrucosa]